MGAIWFLSKERNIVITGFNRITKENGDTELWVKETDGSSRKLAEGQKAIDLENALLDIAKENEGKTVVVATHGGLIKGLQGALMGLSVSELKNIDYVCNASIMEIEYDGEFKITNECISHYLGAMLTEMTKGV